MVDLQVAEAEARAAVVAEANWQEGLNLGDPTLDAYAAAVRATEAARYRGLVELGMVRIAVLIDRMEGRDLAEGRVTDEDARVGRSHRLSLDEGAAWLDEFRAALAENPAPAARLRDEAMVDCETCAHARGRHGWDSDLNPMCHSCVQDGQGRGEKVVPLIAYHSFKRAPDEAMVERVAEAMMASYEREEAWIDIARAALAVIAEEEGADGD